MGTISWCLLICLLLDLLVNALPMYGSECLQPCKGERCEEMAKMMEHLIDFSVDPCEDFFAFSCSTKTRGTRSPVPLKALEPKEDLLKFPPEKFAYMKKFYLSCTNINSGFTTEEVFAKCTEEEGPGGAKCTEEEVREYGEIYVQMLRYTQRFFKEAAFPAVTENWEEETKNAGGNGWTWEGMSAYVLKNFFYLGASKHFGEDFIQTRQVLSQIKTEHFKSNLFFAPLVSSMRFEDDGVHSIYIVPMTIPKRLGHLTTSPQYKKLLVTVLKSFGRNDLTTEADALRILEMEKILFAMRLPSYFSLESYMEDSEYKRRSITIRDLSILVPEVSWKSYIESALDQNPSVHIGPSTKVYIPDTHLMQALGEFLGKLSGRDRANILIWRMFARFANDFFHTGSEQGDLQESQWEAIHSTRRESCLQQMDVFFPNAFNDLTIAKNSDAETTANLNIVFKNVKQEFERIINDQNWMSGSTKKSAIEKVEAMRINVGERTPNTTEYNQLKERVTDDDYIGNILAIGNYHFDSLVKKLNQPIQPETYPSPEQESNAHYNDYRNEFTVLTGLQHEFLGVGLNFDIPAGLLYGGLVVVGHEMLHGFDNLGRLFDKDGLRFNWWRQNESKFYEEKTEHLVSQYQTFSIPYDGEEYSITLKTEAAENIADNGGTRAMYEAYERLPEARKECVPGFNFTSDQLFWIGKSFFSCTTVGQHENIKDYRDLLTAYPDAAGHFPSPWRVNTVFSNFPKFAEAFHCPDGSRLNPANRFAVW